MSRRWPGRRGRLALQRLAPRGTRGQVRTRGEISSRRSIRGSVTSRAGGRDEERPPAPTRVLTRTRRVRARAGSFDRVEGCGVAPRGAELVRGVRTRRVHIRGRWPHTWRLLTAPTRWRSLRACDALPAPASHPSTRPAPVGPSASGPASSRTRLLHEWPRSWAGIADVATSVSAWTAPIQRSRLQSSSSGRRCSTPKPSWRQVPLPRPSSASSLPSHASERGCRPDSAVSCSWRSGSAVLHRPSTTTRIAGSSVAPVRSVGQTRARPPPSCPCSTRRCSSRRSAGATRPRFPALASPRSPSRPRLPSPPLVPVLTWCGAAQLP